MKLPSITTYKPTQEWIIQRAGSALLFTCGHCGEEASARTHPIKDFNDQEFIAAVCPSCEGLNLLVDRWGNSATWSRRKFLISSEEGEESPFKKRSASLSTAGVEVDVEEETLSPPEPTAESTATEAVSEGNSKER